jgi:hypothetical protein
MLPVGPDKREAAKRAPAGMLLQGLASARAALTCLAALHSHAARSCQGDAGLPTGPQGATGGRDTDPEACPAIPQAPGLADLASFQDGIVIRLIAWFPPDAPPVIVLFGNDKAQMGDVFYSSVGSRADQVIVAYLRLSDGGDDD